MSKKIIGITVGTQLPKPNFKQTDPTKGDYIRNKPDFEGLKTQVGTVSELVGDTKVSEQITDAIGKLNKIYAQNEEPIDAQDGALWIDLDEEALGASSSAVLYTEQTLTEEQKAQVRENIGVSGGNANQSGGSDTVGKKWLFIGDSITEHNFRATKNYDEFLAEWLGIVSINRGMSSTGVTHSLTSSPTWLVDLPSYPDDVDYISIMGALNDRHTPLGEWGDVGTDTVYGGVWNYFNNLIAKYPNKPIIYITSTPREYSYGVDGQYTEWVDAFIKTAHNFSIPVLDLYRESGLRPWNATNNKTYFSCSSAPNGDGVHPNELGQELIARKICEFAKVHLLGYGNAVESGGSGGDSGSTEDEVQTIDNISWEIGALVSSTGENEDPKRIRTGFIDVTQCDGITIKISSGYYVICYDYENYGDTVSINAPSWGATASTVVHECTGNYVRLVVKRSDNGSMSASEGATAISVTRGYDAAISTMNNFSWELGALGSGKEQDNTKRIRTGFIDVSQYGNIVIQVADGYSAAIIDYDTVVNYTSTSSYGTGTITHSCKGDYVKLVVKRNDEGTMTASEGATAIVSIGGTN